MTSEDLDILLQTLGLRNSVKPYRNHYIIGPECDGWDSLKHLEAAGLIQRVQSPGFLASSDAVFTATEEGRRVAQAEALRRRPRLTRDQRRYRRWLAASDAYPGLTFGAWLRAGCRVPGVEAAS